MKLHENKRLFRQAIVATAESMQIPEIYIEKDYWVTYDLHQLLQNTETKVFFDSEAFETLLLSAAKSDATSYKNNHSWLGKHPNEALIFSDLEKVWAELRPVYQGEFSNLVFGQLPDEVAILKTLTTIKERLSEIQWPADMEKR